MELSQAIELAKELLIKHSKDNLNLQGWGFSFNRRKRAFGLCSYNKKEIQLSSLLVPAMTVEAVTDTILHEIAHALTKGHGHDRVWRAKCLELGGNGKRCGGSDKYFEGAKGRNDVLQAMSKYVLTCPVCNEKYYRSRKPKRSSGCGMHGRGYQEKYKLVLSLNY